MKTSIICVFVWLFYILLPSYRQDTYSPTRISWYVVTSMPITPSDFVFPIPLMLQVCFVKSLLWNKTSPRLLISLLTFQTVMIIMCLGLISLSMNDATYAAKEITEWVEIGIDCYIPLRKFQLTPHSSPWFTPCVVPVAHYNHYFHRYHRNATTENKKLFCDFRNHCKKVLKDARSNYAEATRCSVASQLIGFHDLWRICNIVLNMGNSTLDGSGQLTDFPSRTEQKLSTENITTTNGFLCNLRSSCIQSHWPRQNSIHCP